MLVIIFSATNLYWNSQGISTPTSFVIAVLAKPIILVLGGTGLMIGSIAASLGNTRATSAEDKIDNV
ncbi:hypothetical protein [Thermoactinospora rubra]|uniref:hypothetical protein n=1 Tax=Thermoactinospora rubra TaxID=1088767 RepID=UPI00117F28C4|nr:hypothetical protein [Thermoactinospora rubra]